MDTQTNDEQRQPTVYRVDVPKGFRLTRKSGDVLLAESGSDLVMWIMGEAYDLDGFFVRMPVFSGDGRFWELWGQLDPYSWMRHPSLGLRETLRSVVFGFVLGSALTLLLAYLFGNPAWPGWYYTFFVIPWVALFALSALAIDECARLWRHAKWRWKIRPIVSKIQKDDLHTFLQAVLESGDTYRARTAEEWLVRM